jgi:tripartite ATP-independent transporter DctP family solute receptor
MKKFFALLLTLAMVLSLAACGGKEEKPADKPAEAPSAGTEAPAADPIVLRVSHKSSENSSWQKGAEKWDELLNERTNGAIRLEIHPNSALGDQKESTEACQLGVIDIVLNAPATLAGFMSEISALDLPFLFNSAEQAYEVTNSEIGEKIFEGFEEFGLVYLAEGDNGMRHISTTNRPINTAEDVKGLKIRVPESQLYLDVWSALGATPIGLALPELAPALANGTAEGQDNATYHLVANATYDSIKYFSNINYMWMGCTMAINAAKWASLSGEVQEILKEQAKVAAKYSFDTIAEDNETATKVLQDAGVEFNFEPDVQSFKDALGGDEYYKRYEGESWYSQELLDAILAVVR